METSAYAGFLVERHASVGSASADSASRSDFERDRDRVIYSSAYRALAAKTQVVASTELGLLHNRLTHSLKVAQVGKSIASRLFLKGAKVDPVLVETACLAHDIGHPPFGHAGEEALNEVVEHLRREQWKRDNPATDTGPDLAPPEVWDGFEGNAQNLRVLTYLATHRSYESPGLHLTRASLLATTKYPWQRTLSIKGGRKWGAYDADAITLEWLLDGVPIASDGRPQPIFEKELMDWADDVTYAVHDMEDWYRHGVIPLHELFEFQHPAGHRAAGRDESPALREFLDGVEAKWTGQGDEFDRIEIVKLLHSLGDFVSVDGRFDGTRYAKGKTEATVSDLICYLADDVAYDGDGFAYDGYLVVPEERRLLCNVLQELVWHYVIDGASLAAQQHGQQRIIKRLVHWIQEDYERLLPADRLEELGEHGDLTRTIADHVATLTEPMAISLYGKLSGNALGSITDVI